MVGGVELLQTLRFADDIDTIAGEEQELKPQVKTRQNIERCKHKLRQWYRERRSSYMDRS